MINQPKLTVSGYRGVWGETLDEQITFEFISAFARVIKEKKGKKILIGRDSRKSGPKILEVIANTLEKESLKFDDVGIIPTPSVLLLVKKLKYDGGIIITASHNPIEYNGLKFVTKDGLFAGTEIIEKINQLKQNIKENYKRNKKYIPQKNNQWYRKIHIEKILKNVESELIKNKKYKVSLDTINGAGGVIMKELLEELGCKVNLINGRQDGLFAHKPEPLKKNLGQLSKVVLKNKSDIGFASDPDGDRLIVVNEKGEILSEECTLTIALKDILEINKSDVVVNMSTSNMCKDVVESFGRKLIRSKVGELNVVNKMFEINSTISGEGNGGVIYPKINTARDALVGMALILELMTKKNKKVSEIVKEIPEYVMKKEKITFNNNLNLLNKKLKKEFSDSSSVNELDGIRFDWPDSSWIHIRPSNTEPIVRIYGEAKQKERINQLIKIVKSLV